MRIAERLRAPDGCPWDREQTHASARVKIEPPRLDLPLDIDDQDFLGELLFDIVAAARDAGFDAETALREANDRFSAHVGRLEARAIKDGRALESYAPDEMRRVWEETA